MSHVNVTLTLSIKMMTIQQTTHPRDPVVLTLMCDPVFDGGRVR